MVGRLPLKLNTEGKVSCQDELLIAGHPYGVPMTYANDGIASCSEELQGAVYGDIDSFNGNSGSQLLI